jgi:membrane-associated phospholipid phosphatase
MPTVAVLATLAGLIALDPAEGRYFHESTAYKGFNNVMSSNNVALGTIAAPLALYAAGFVGHDKKATATALFAGEAVADAEIVTMVLKDATRRVRPRDIPPSGNYADTWFESKGSAFRSNGGFPSGHTIAAFSIATVVARRYGNHRWVPYAAYGAAALVGFSRLTLSAHFLSDVFMGGALGYSISRFAVLQQ